jgi:hypothetical protein
MVIALVVGVRVYESDEQLLLLHIFFFLQGEYLV